MLDQRQLVHGCAPYFPEDDVRTLLNGIGGGGCRREMYEGDEDGFHLAFLRFGRGAAVSGHAAGFGDAAVAIDANSAHTARLMRMVAFMRGLQIPFALG